MLDKTQLECVLFTDFILDLMIPQKDCRDVERHQLLPSSVFKSLIDCIMLFGSGGITLQQVRSVFGVLIPADPRSVNESYQTPICDS